MVGLLTLQSLLSVVMVPIILFAVVAACLSVRPSVLQVGSSLPHAGKSSKGLATSTLQNRGVRTVMTSRASSVSPDLAEGSKMLLFGDEFVPHVQQETAPAARTLPDDVEVLDLSIWNDASDDEFSTPNSPKQDTAAPTPAPAPTKFNTCTISVAISPKKCEIPSALKAASPSKLSYNLGGDGPLVEEVQEEEEWNDANTYLMDMDDVAEGDGQAVQTSRKQPAAGGEPDALDVLLYEAEEVDGAEQLSWLTPSKASVRAHAAATVAVADPPAFDLAADQPVTGGLGGDHPVEMTAVADTPIARPASVEVTHTPTHQNWENNDISYGDLVLVNRFGVETQTIQIYEPFMFGSGAECGIRINVNGVSEQHVYLDIDQASNSVTIINLCTDNPVMVVSDDGSGGATTRPLGSGLEATLSHNDKFLVCERAFIYRMATPPTPLTRTHTPEDGASNLSVVFEEITDFELGLGPAPPTPPTRIHTPADSMEESRGPTPPTPPTRTHTPAESMEEEEDYDKLPIPTTPPGSTLRGFFPTDQLPVIPATPPQQLVLSTTPRRVSPGTRIPLPSPVARTVNMPTTGLQNAILQRRAFANGENVDSQQSRGRDLLGSLKAEITAGVQLNCSPWHQRHYGRDLAQSGRWERSPSPAPELVSESTTATVQAVEGSTQMDVSAPEPHASTQSAVSMFDALVGAEHLEAAPASAPAASSPAPAALQFPIVRTDEIGASTPVNQASSSFAMLGSTRKWLEGNKFKRTPFKRGSPLSKISNRIKVKAGPKTPLAVQKAANLFELLNTLVDTGAASTSTKSKTRAAALKGRTAADIRADASKAAALAMANQGIEQSKHELTEANATLEKMSADNHALEHQLVAVRAEFKTVSVTHSRLEEEHRSVLETLSSAQQSMLEMKVREATSTELVVATQEKLAETLNALEAAQAEANSNAAKTTESSNASEQLSTQLDATFASAADLALRLSSSEASGEKLRETIETLTQERLVGDKALESFRLQFVELVEAAASATNQVESFKAELNLTLAEKELIAEDRDEARKELVKAAEKQQAATFTNNAYLLLQTDYAKVKSAEESFVLSLKSTRTKLATVELEVSMLGSEISAVKLARDQATDQLATAEESYRMAVEEAKAGASVSAAKLATALDNVSAEKLALDESMVKFKAMSTKHDDLMKDHVLLTKEMTDVRAKHTLCKSQLETVTTELNTAQTDLLVQMDATNQAKTEHSEAIVEYEGKLNEKEESIAVFEMKVEACKVLVSTLHAAAEATIVAHDEKVAALGRGYDGIVQDVRDAHAADVEAAKVSAAALIQTHSNEMQDQQMMHVGELEEAAAATNALAQAHNEELGEIIMKQTAEQEAAQTAAAALVKSHANQMQECQLQHTEELDATKAAADAFLSKHQARAAATVATFESKIKAYSAIIVPMASAMKTMSSDYIQLQAETKALGDSIPELIQGASEALTQTLTETNTQYKDMRLKYRTEMRQRKSLHNELVDLKGNIRVYGRLRPVIAEDGDGSAVEMVCVRDKTDDQLLHVTTKGKEGKRAKHQDFDFDKIFTPESTQDAVFAGVRELVVSVVDGYNVCIFAYGQTGSGKTYTMEGTDADPGLNRRALAALFEACDDRNGEWTFELEVSVMEIYNERLRDLLCDRSGEEAVPDLDIKHARDGKLVIDGLTSRPVTNVEDVRESFAEAKTIRATASTQMNNQSSRSHCLLVVTVRGTNVETGKQSIGKLNLIDLAGSERVGKSGALDDAVRLKEATSINKSLAALGDVIHALGAKQKHIPYRNSKLTHLLSDSLGGKSKTLMLVQISPVEKNVTESICSLNFGQRVKAVELGTAKKTTESKEVAALKKKIKELEEKSGGSSA
jgi:kinesin family protein C2/C3